MKAFILIVWVVGGFAYENSEPMTAAGCYRAAETIVGSQVAGQRVIEARCIAGLWV